MKSEFEVRILRLVRRVENPDFLAERAEKLAPFVCRDSMMDPVLIAQQRMMANKKFSRTHWEKMRQQKTLE